MIAPLNINIPVLFQFIHHQMGTVAPIIDISDNMKLVNNRILYQMADSGNKFIRAAGINDRLKYLFIILFLIEVLAPGGQQFRDDIFKIPRKHFPDFRGVVFGSCDPAYRDKLF